MHSSQVIRNTAKKCIQHQPLSCKITSLPFLWLPLCPNISKQCPSWNNLCLSSIPISVLVLQISGQEPRSGWYTSVIEFLSVAATYILPTHLMNNAWAPYAAYSSPTLLIWLGLSSALNTPVINPEVPLNGIETTEKNTHAQLFQICMSSSYGSFTSLSTGSGQNTRKHLVTQAFNLHSVLTLMTSKCGLDCGTEHESSDCLCPSEFYMGLSPQPRGSSTIAGKGWIYLTGPVRMLTSFSFFFLGNSLLFTEPFTKGF